MITSCSIRREAPSVCVDTLVVPGRLRFISFWSQGLVDGLVRDRVTYLKHLATIVTKLTLAEKYWDGHPMPLHLCSQRGSFDFGTRTTRPQEGHNKYVQATYAEMQPVDRILTSRRNFYLRIAPCLHKDCYWWFFWKTLHTSYRISWRTQTSKHLEHFEFDLRIDPRLRAHLRHLQFVCWGFSINYSLRYKHVPYA